MFNEKIESIKKQTTHTIVGAYISGVAKDTAYISKDTSLKTLGESFCNFGTEVDLVQNDLVDLSKINTAPKAGGVVSNLIRQSNNKIDGYARNIKTLNLPLAESTELLKEYANKIQKAAISVAFAEGAEDDELKQDIRVLLKEGKDEFIKREQEEQAEEEATLEDEQAPEFEDDTDYTELEEPEEEGLEEEQSEEGFEDAGDEEGFVDEDGNPIEKFAEAEGDDEFSDEIPSGKFESNIYDTTGLEAHGETKMPSRLDKLRNKPRDKKVVIAESFNLPVELMNDEKAFNRALNDRNLLKSYSEDYRYLYNGELISVTPFEMDKMKRDLLAIEKSSVQALGESAGISNVLESDELQLAHKATVNELAVVMVARNRFGL